jgi:hypothetical protein
MPELVIGDAAPAELRLLAATLVARVPGPWKVSAIGFEELRLPSGVELRSSGTAGDGAVLLLDAREWTLRLEGGRPRLASPEGKSTAVPWVIAGELFSPSEWRDREIPRILFEGGGDERRLKMALRTVEELRRRHYRFTAVAVGRVEPSMISVAAPDEVHEDLSAAEYLALVSSGTAVLECTDAYGAPSPLSVAARAAGLPLVIHTDHADLAAAAFRAAGMWSAEAFADAITQSDFERTAGVPFNEEIEAIREVLSSR